MVRPLTIGMAAALSLTAVMIPKRISANPPHIAERSVAAVSLNLAKEGAADRVVNALWAAPRLRDADVYLFQEVRHQTGRASVAEEAARKLGYSASFQAAPQDIDQGLAIISRYPLKNVRILTLKSCDLRFRSRSRFAMAATMTTPWGDVRVWNVHLDTRINAAERLAQLQPVLDEASTTPGPRLIGGDFNTNELYWVGNVLPLPFGPAHGSTIRTLMKERGFESPFGSRVNTFPLFGSHLDWFFLRDLKPVGASVEPARFSDHNAIWVRAQL